MAFDAPAYANTMKKTFIFTPKSIGELLLLDTALPYIEEIDSTSGAYVTYQANFTEP